MSFVRVLIFPLLVSVCVAAQATRRLVYFCEVKADRMQLKNPFPHIDLSKEGQLGRQHIDFSRIVPPEEFRAHEPTNTYTSGFGTLIRRLPPCQPIYADIDAKGSMSFH
jgi:hypothetical protein